MSIARMQVMHGFTVSDDERRILVKYLADKQGLAPSETEGMRYAMERRLNTVEQFDEHLSPMCGRRHSVARVALQHCPAKEWEHLVNFHLGQWPSLEYQALSRDRDWLDIALKETVPDLAKRFPLDSQDWTEWQKAKPKADALAGQWSFSGHMLARDDVRGVMTVSVNPTQILSDHYVVKPPRLEVFRTRDGLDAKPVRSFPMPRQVYLMRAAAAGTLYVAGPDIYKMDVKTGKYEVAVPGRNWQRPPYSSPDVVYFWPHQTPLHEFSMLYTTARFKDEKQDPATADLIYGFVSIDLKTGESMVQDFAPLTELYFTGLRSPKDPNQMFGVLNRLAKYDIKEQKLIKATSLDHSYYCIAFNTQGSKLYLAGALDDIAVYDPESLEKLNNIKLPGGDMAAITAQGFVR